MNGQLWIGYARGCASLNDEEPHVTPIEYKLLYLLYKKSGQGADRYLQPKELSDGAESVLLTINGATLESGHTVYDFPLTFTE